MRSEVEKQLFASRSTFSGALRQIQAAVSELSSVSFAHANPNHTYTLQEYGELQAATREQKAKPALDSIMDRIQKVVQTAAGQQGCVIVCWDCRSRPAGMHKACS